jgi:hypothetical protein
MKLTRPLSALTWRLIPSPLWAETLDGVNPDRIIVRMTIIENKLWLNLFFENMVASLLRTLKVLPHLANLLV